MAGQGIYRDNWVVDRTLFEYLNQGNCSCCGVSHAMMDVLQFYQLCSDLETDDEQRELNHSQWPPFMQREIWADRVRIRTSLKNGMLKYQRFMEKEWEHFTHWWINLMPMERELVFEMPIDEVKVIFNVNVGVTGCYSAVLCSVMEQVKRFRDTNYPPDGRTEAEADFEDALETNRGAFVVHREYTHSREGVEAFFGMFKQLAGPSLLPRGEHGWRCEGDALEGEGGKEDGSPPSTAGSNIIHLLRDKGDLEITQSFRADRRLVRLVIFRFFADRAIDLFFNKRSTARAEETHEVGATLLSAEMQLMRIE